MTTPERRRMVAVKGHPGIYKKNKAFLVRWRHHGRLKTRSFRTLTEAGRFKAQTAAGDTFAGSREPFRRYVLEWVDTYTGRTSRGITAGTRESYRDAVTRFAIPFFGTVPLDRIDPPMLREFIAYLSDKGLAPASVQRAYAPVRALLATAYEDGRIRTNPAAGVRVVIPGAARKRKRRLTAVQTRNLLAAIPAEHADLAYLMASTGCRISEALQARWEDLGRDDLGRPTLAIPKAKTPAGERTLPLTPQAARRLMARRAAAADATGVDPIFPSAAGTHLDASNWRREVFGPARKAAGVEWATPHDLRHGLASLLTDHGFSPAQVAAQLGHADGGVLALRTYVHADPLDSVEFIDTALSGA